MTGRPRRDGPDSLRIEEWESDGARTLLAVAARGRNALACALRVGPGGTSWLHAEAWFPRGALRAPRSAIAAALPFAPAGRREAERFLGRGGMGLAARLAVATPAFLPDLDAAIRPREGLVGPPDLPEGWAPQPRPGCLTALAGAGDPGPDANPPALAVPSPRGVPETPPLDLAPPAGLAGGRAGLYLIACVAEALRPAAERMWAHAGAEVREVLGPGAWTPALHARHADPATSRRRLQALRLHPWAAQAVASDPAMSGLVDAGRPFEEALAAKASAWSDRLAAVPLGRAALRRLRGMRPLPDPVDLLRVLEAAARLAPGPAFPDDGTPGRIARADHACRLFLGGLSIPDDGALLRSLPAEARGEAGPEGFEAALSRARDTLWNVADMLTAFAETLGQPLCGDPLAPVAGAAARLFSPDLSYAGLAAASRRWHRDHARFRAALPGPPPDARWPALFDPVDLPGGIRAACLVSPGELADEGGPGPDAAGLAGLDHCVSGYARRCLDAESHIASLRQGPGGPRLSTLEIRAEGVAPPRIVQHRGRGNAAPCAPATAAAAALLGGLRSGAIPIRPEAVPDPGRPRAAAPPPGPEALGRALAAWIPFLAAGPRDLATVRARLAEGLAHGTERPGQAYIR